MNGIFMLLFLLPWPATADKRIGMVFCLRRKICESCCRVTRCGRCIISLTGLRSGHASEEWTMHKRVHKQLLESVISSFNCWPVRQYKFIIDFFAFITLPVFDCNSPQICIIPIHLCPSLALVLSNSGHGCNVEKYIDFLLRWTTVTEDLLWGSVELLTGRSARVAWDFRIILIPHFKIGKQKQVICK